MTLGIVSANGLTNEDCINDAQNVAQLQDKHNNSPTHGYRVIQSAPHQTT